MSNIFMKEVMKHSDFSWDRLGDIKVGRESLGEDMPVIVYRLLQYSINHVLVKEYGQDFSDKVFREAGDLVGQEFAKNSLDLSLGFDAFVSQLQQRLKEFKIGILRIEEFNHETLEFVLTIGEDLDCSGLPVTDEVVCTFDEGFLEGILNTYTGKKYNVKEIDCWASGDRVCRFKGKCE